VHGDVWFYASPERWRDDDIVLDPDESHHATNVLRAKPPDVITITDGNGLVARCALTKVDGDEAVASILDRTRLPAPVPQLSVYQGAAKGQKNDDVVERLAELGVAYLTVFGSRRAVVRWDEDKKNRLRERWSGIAIAAAKQSRNAHAMRSHGVVDWDELLVRVAEEPQAVALWEGADLPLRTALGHGARRIALIVGPEGGFERDEADALADAGAQLVSLGPRIFRTENAAAFAAAAVMYHYGTFG
jgi:16S rRNA (uracil1498-N3)-methyltransferase